MAQTASYEERLQQLKTWLGESKATVFLGGAGVSTASGIPDFRSAHGLYMQKKAGLSYEEMLSHQYFEDHPAEFYDFLRKVMLYPDAKPNPAHYALAKLEREGKLQAVVTQNIDGLHQKAGSRKVYELHGSVLRNYCENCGKFYPAEFVQQAADIPRCTCGGIVKPDVVLYEESLDEKTITASLEAIAQADMLMVAGTSLTVYPAAGLIRYYPGNRLVLINRDETPYDSMAKLVFHDSLGEIFSAL